MDESNWEVLGNSMRVLFSKYDPDILHGIGPETQRLEYTQFEAIIVHLIFIIDPSICRRRFKPFYPAKDEQGKSKFFENCIKFINDSQISPTRVSISQLKSFGGLPFRRILFHMVKRAAELELSKNSNLDTAPNIDQSSENLNNEIDAAYRELRQSVDDLEESSIEYDLKEEKINVPKSEISKYWISLNQASFGQCDKVEPNISQMRNIEKALLRRIELSYARYKELERKIREIPLPSVLKVSPVAKKESIRMSQYFKEIRECLYKSPKTSSSVAHRLLQCKENMDNLTSRWRAVSDQFNELLLLNPKMQERYKFFEDLIPLVEITPMNLLDDPSDYPSLEEIKSVLAEYPDTRFD